MLVRQKASHVVSLPALVLLQRAVADHLTVGLEIYLPDRRFALDQDNAMQSHLLQIAIA